MNKLHLSQICPDDNELAQFVEGKLIGQKLKSIKLHLESCKICNNAVRLAIELNALEKLQIDNIPKTDSNKSKDGGNFIAGASISAALINLIDFSGHHVPMVAENNLVEHERNHEYESSITKTNNLNDMGTNINNAPNHFGEEAKIDVSSHVYQGYSDTCAVRSQQLVLNDFGIPVSQEDLIKEATQNGWYAQGEGTPLDYVGNLLENHGVEVNKFENANIYNLTNELAQGHKIIIGVDANELWHNGFWQNTKDSILGDTPNHALIVAGIDTSDPNHIQVILEDPGTGDVAKAYPMEQFMDAWKDSNCFMVSTHDAAPLAYNSEMSSFNYDVGNIEFIGNMPYDYFNNTILPIHENLSLGSSLQNNLLSEFKEMVLGEKFSLSALFDKTIDSLWMDSSEPIKGMDGENNLILDDDDLEYIMPEINSEEEFNNFDWTHENNIENNEDIDDNIHLT